MLARSGLEGLEQPSTPGQVPGLEQRRLHRDVPRRFVDTLVKIAHAVTDIEADIPEQADQRLQAGMVGDVAVVVDKEEQIDVGCRIEFTPAITTDRHQRHIGRHVHLFPDGAQDAIDQPCTSAQIGTGRAGALVGGT